MIFGQTIHWASAGLSLVFGYLLGSIPFGLIFAWIAGAGDVRKIGSGNIGATNVLRTGKRWAAVATLVFDAGKGAAAVLIAAAFYGQIGAVFAALGAFLGHLFPVWLGFKGGKGGATALGVALALAWPAALAAAATWLLVAVISRISSLATLTTALLAPLYMYFFSGPLTALLAVILGVLMFIMHRANIARLLSGTEPRIGAKKAP
jgi:acyl phosphate:glycerol-3-phosphate acyltransferase